MSVSWTEYAKSNLRFNSDQVVQCVLEVFDSYFSEKDLSKVKSIVDRNSLCNGITGLLMTRFGSWISGWTWSNSEPGGGGPVRKWCCADHSMFSKEDKEVNDTAIRIKDAVQDWYEYLLFLHGFFDELGQELPKDGIDDHFEKAAIRILNHVLDRTDAMDAWYYTFVTVYGWYLEYHGIAGVQISDKIDELISGRFESWCAPNDDLAAEVCLELGEIVLKTESEEGVELEPVDAIAFWQPARDQLLSAYSKYPFKIKFLATKDAHKELIEEYDFKRSSERAERLLEVLELSRGLAKAKEPLSWEILSEWQGKILGYKTDFRTTEAFAKNGKEKYKITQYTELEFKKLIKDVNDETIDPILRAATVYQDIIFYHPFEDGNSRLARMALEYVLFKAKLAVILPEPLFMLPRYPEPFGFYMTLKSVVGLKRFE